MANFFQKKDVDLLIKDAEESLANGKGQLVRSLTLFNLIMLGIGAIVGAGIFSITGAAAAFYSGPAIVYSFILGGLICTFAGLCYAEMAAMVPVSGSAYAYSYATMGELIAWIIGWDLLLEYGFGAVTVSASWSGYFVSLVHKTLEIPMSDLAIRLTKGPWETVILNSGVEAYGLWNLPASFIAAVITAILYRGMKQSSWANNLVVVLKISIIFAFIFLGWSVVDTANWFANPNATGLGVLVPPASFTFRHGEEYLSYGWPGVLTGAGVVFFAYIGFDAISTTAQECKNPRRDLPIGILASLIICTLLYVVIALVLTGIVPYRELGVPDPIALGIDRIVYLRHWGPDSQKWFSAFIKLGALAGLSSVILVMMLGQTRVCFAMAKDGLVPWFGAIHREFSTPHIATAICGLFVIICSGVTPLSLVGELVSMGTLFAFLVVCAGIPILRIRAPHLNRPFKAPLYWFIAPAGVAACIWVMSGFPVDTWIRLSIWMALGLVVYFGYGYRKSKLRYEKPE